MITRTDLMQHIQALMAMLDDAEDHELEAIAAHAGDVVARAKEMLRRRAELDNRLFWTPEPPIEAAADPDAEREIVPTPFDAVAAE